MKHNSSVSMPQVEEQGLSADDVQSRVTNHQVNRADTKSSRSLLQILRENVFTFFNALIFSAMVLVLLTGQWKDAVFGFVIIVNSGIGVATELQAKATLDRLSILVASNFLVRRDSKDVEIPGEQIVIDDMLWIRSGEQIPADCKIAHSYGLELDESMLTGESRTVRKKDGDEALSGTTAVSGLALGKVVAVGKASYAARLTAKAKVYSKNRSDLNEGINKILKVMTIVVIPLCILLIWTQMRTVGGFSQAFASGHWRQAVVAAVAGVVGMIPEGLVLLTSLNFALATIRLARKNTLVQELESVETLARVDALNLDKTGTITDGGIAFEQLIALDSSNEEPSHADQHAQHAQHAQHDQHDLEQRAVDVSGEDNPNATAEAILKGLDSYTKSQDIEARLPFSSSRKWSAIRYADGSTWYLGAPEILSSSIASTESSQQSEDQLTQQVEQLASAGSRVLLLAEETQTHTDSAEREISEKLPGALHPHALIACSERIRTDAKRTLSWFRDQGVRCRLISGDNPATVGAIAAKVELTGQQQPRVMDARKLPEDIHQLASTLEDVDVLGRVLPEQKKAIVEALHTTHHVVAMTGDGVNDSLALKEADLGIAMGNAAPATKAVAQVVLVDSKFSHLPDVVARGRQVMANMERVASLFVVKTVYSALISLGVVLTAIPFPYLPRHITYIGSLTIGIPAFLLALAPNTRAYKPGFLSRVVAFALPSGIATGLSVLLAAWLIPEMMHWNLGNDADLNAWRMVCAIILFVMGILVLCRVARPLRSWRGILVAAFALIGILGAVIPPVASFFQLIIPSGRLMLVSLIAMLCAALLFAAITWVADRFSSHRQAESELSQS
ncbi:HAD-IC family P-type ATPase [Bifidobacterium aquikefiricola]|uniref:HAD-IC family P-type ATPase n=1 Tax=Bifidobacterium aquikefiricola TaxID=3059038 RepID=A0AB39U9Q7_9BIFI